MKTRLEFRILRHEHFHKNTVYLGIPTAAIPGPFVCGEDTGVEGEGMDTVINTLRTPWSAEPTDRWPSLFSVYDCDGNVVAAAKSKEVAGLIAAAPDTKRRLDELLSADKAISVYADPQYYNMGDWDFEKKGHLIFSTPEA